LCLENFQGKHPKGFVLCSNVTFQEVLWDWNACRGYHLLVLGQSFWKFTFVPWILIEFGQNFGNLWVSVNGFVG
jgi:hypothetical protein